MSKNKNVTNEVTSEANENVSQANQHWQDVNSKPARELPPIMQPNVVPEPPKSEAVKTIEVKIETAKAAYKAARFDESVTVEQLAQFGNDVTKANAELKSQLLNEANEASAAKIKALREARVKLGEDRDEAFYGWKIYPNDETIEAYQKAKEAVDHYLLGGVQPLPRTVKADEAKPTGTRGGVTAKINELIAPMYANGMTGTQVRAAIKLYPNGQPWDEVNGGFNDGTANAAIRNYELANGLIAK